MEKILMILENLYNKKIITNYQVKRAEYILYFSFKVDGQNVELDCLLDEAEKIPELKKNWIDEYDAWCESIVA